MALTTGSEVLRQAFVLSDRHGSLRHVSLLNTGADRSWSRCSAELDQRIVSYDRRVRELYRSRGLCRRIGNIEDIGPVTATALVAVVGDRTCFKNGRQYAAWPGLVPKRQSNVWETMR
ncbi:MAG: transposase [Geminicoccaceae bacterium]